MINYVHQNTAMRYAIEYTIFKPGIFDGGFQNPIQNYQKGFWVWHQFNLGDFHVNDKTISSDLPSCSWPTPKMKRPLLLPLRSSNLPDFWLSQNEYGFYVAFSTNPREFLASKSLLFILPKFLDIKFTAESIDRYGPVWRSPMYSLRLSQTVHHWYCVQHPYIAGWRT